MLHFRILPFRVVPTVALALALAATGTAAPAGVTSLPAVAGVVRFRVDVPAPRLAPLPADPALSQLLIAGYETLARGGEPALPARIVLVAVPPSGAVRLRAVGSATEDLPAALLAPAPGPGGDAAAPGYARSARAYAVHPAPGREPARLLDVSWMRNQRVARVAVEPAEYDPVTRRLTVRRQIEVEIEVEPPAAIQAPAEPRDPFEGVYREALVNYEQGKGWRRAARQEGAAGIGARGPGAQPLVATVSPETTVFAGRVWAKIAVRQTGFYRVEFGQLRNTALFGGDTTIALDRLRLFTWPGFPVLPEDGYCDSCDYREVAIQFVDNGNGIFSNNHDYFYFFALGPSDWADLYDPNRPDTVFIDNPYETKSYYYLTYSSPQAPIPGSPLRILPQSGAVQEDGSEAIPTTFAERLHYEVDAEYFPNPYPNPVPYTSNLFWEKWFWRSINSGTSFTTQVDAPGADTTAPAGFRMRAWSLEWSCEDHEILHGLDVTFNDIVFPRREWEGMWAQNYDTTFSSGLRTAGNSLSLSVPNIDPCNAASGLAWLNLYYRRRFIPVGDALTFDSPGGGGNYIFRLAPFARQTPPRVFDVTDPYVPLEITGCSYDAVPGGHQLSFETLETGRRRYRVMPDSLPAIVAPDVGDAPFSSLDNLRSRTWHADYLVIYYDAFKAAADSLVAWRGLRLPIDGNPGPYETMAVPVSAIFDQFSGGRIDPAGLRNFLRAVWLNWRKVPAFVTLLGSASYDFKNITGRAPEGQPGCLLPTYEGAFDPGPQRQFSTDDWILNVDTATVVIPDFFGGRIPAGDVQTALDIVQRKVLLYERSTPLGEWRNRLMLIADDNVQVGQPNNVDPVGWGHLESTSQLDTTVTPPHIDRDYVYLHTYPTGPAVTKPAAKADVIKGVDDGVILLNFIGHGSPFKITDEGVLLDSDAGTLTNAIRPTVFIAASCDVGRLDDPAVASLGQRLLAAPGGGCVAVISATELAYAYFNFLLNQGVFSAIFDRDTSGTGQYHVPLSAALLSTKQGYVNNQKYQLMGDAGTRLNLPRRWVELQLMLADGTPVDSLMRGETMRFRGRVIERPGSAATVPVNGVASLLVEDSAPYEQAPGCIPGNPCFYPFYYFRAGPVFRGDVAMAGGQFEGQFFVPLDATGGPRGRLRAYVQGRPPGEQYDSDAVGSMGLQVASGVPPSGDNEGPRIGLSFVTGSTSVRPDAVLRVDLFDPVGILITGHTPQNGIIVTVDDNTTARVDITPTFRYAADSYQSGRAFFQLPNLAPGPHHVRVSAADNLASGLSAVQHRAAAELAFEVVAVPRLNVSRAYLFPNPTQSGGARSGGAFVIDAPGDSVNVLLRLYTVSGRLIRTLRAFGGLGQIQIPWDGRDDEGYPLANGTYLFKVHVNARDSSGRSSARQEAISEGRFVILNNR